MRRTSSSAHDTGPTSRPVFDRDPAPDDCEDLVQRLIYRADLPYRKEFSAIRYPPELNRRPGWLAAVGPYVSVICGQSDFLANAIFTSAVQGVAAAAQLRAIRQAAYADVALLRGPEARSSTRDRRRTLERIADQLGDLELELSYSVEATADLTDWRRVYRSSPGPRPGAG